MCEIYDQAALRHFRDADFLAADKRWDNAGHLIGFAAECALKHAIVSLRPNQNVPHKHLPELQDIAKKHLNQRTHRGLHGLLIQTKYFDGWVVDGRYSGDDSVSEDTYKDWRVHATRILGAAGIRNS